jgi:hypothetical protein
MIGMFSKSVSCLNLKVMISCIWYEEAVQLQHVAFQLPAFDQLYLLSASQHSESLVANILTESLSCFWKCDRLSVRRFCIMFCPDFG